MFYNQIAWAGSRHAAFAVNFFDCYKRTKNIIDEVASMMIEHFRESLENEQEKNELLIGVPAILNAMRSGKIECRVFDSNKFHAKAYIRIR